jgi:hypothetical protein
MIVFTQEEFYRMNIDGIHVGSGGCLLVVMVFVNVGVHGRNVKYSMEDGIEKVVNKEQDGKRTQEIPYRYVVEMNWNSVVL